LGSSVKWIRENADSGKKEGTLQTGTGVRPSRIKKEDDLKEETKRLLREDVRKAQQHALITGRERGRGREKNGGNLRRVGKNKSWTSISERDGE